MMRYLIPICLALFFSQCCVAQYKHGPDSMRQKGVPRGKITKHAWQSKIFRGTSRDYWIYVPAQYDGKTPACVMVFQDGKWYVEEKRDFRIPVVFDNLIHKKEMPVTIGIFINPGVIQTAGKKSYRNRSFEYDTLSDQYARFLEHEILPEVGKKYKLRQDSAARAICGISSGGICAFTVAWQRPDLFSKVLSHVGSFTNIRGGDRYPGMIRKAKSRNIRVFLQAGANDLNNQHGHWPLANQQMAKALAFRKYDYKFVYGTEGHNGKHGGAIMPESLRWLWRDTPPAKNNFNTDDDLISAQQAKNHWPQFRGPGSLGVVENDNLPTRWSKKKNVVWAKKITGKGWSSPIVWGNKVIITATINPKTPKSRKGLYIRDLYGKIPPGACQFMVYCYDLNSGKLLWKKTARKGKAKGPVHIKNSYASETPATDGERIYAYFGNHGLFCFDMNGKELWQKKIGPYKTRMGWGTGASPIVHDGRVYLLCDNEQQSFLLALDAKTGAEVWKVKRNEKSNWSTPYIWQNKQRTEIVTAGTGKVRSYDLKGKLLWELRGMSSITIPTPFAKNGLLYINSGYVGDFRRRPIFCIRPGAKGDISLKKDETKNKYIVWSNRFIGTYHPSALVYRDYLYVLYDRGYLACFDAKTGKEIYEKQRLPARHFTASPWAYNGKIFCQSEDGDTFVIKAGTKFELVERNVLDGEMTLATPALAGDSVILRSNHHLYRIANTKE